MNISIWFVAFFLLFEDFTCADIDPYGKSTKFKVPYTLFTHRHVKDKTECACGVFLDSQVTKDGQILLGEEPVFAAELHLGLNPCSTLSSAMCERRCLDMFSQRIAEMGSIVCAEAKRDGCVCLSVNLFVKNCVDIWRRSPGFLSKRTICCEDGNQVDEQNLRGNEVRSISSKPWTEQWRPYDFPLPTIEDDCQMNEVMKF